MKNSDFLTSLAKTIFSVFKNAWPFWSSFVSLLLGLGIIQIDAVKLIIPKEYIGYIFVGIFSTWLLIALGVLSYQKVKLENQINKITKEVDELRNKIQPIFYVDGIFVSALMLQLDHKTTPTINPVKLKKLSVNCKIGGEVSRKDADVFYRFQGINKSDNILTGIYFSISADNLIPFRELKSRFYLDLKYAKSPEAKPILVSPDSVTKTLFLPFIQPGIKSLEEFDCGLGYQWPGIFSTVKDYWFVDYSEFESAPTELVMFLEFLDFEIDYVKIFRLDMNRKIPIFEGVVTSNPEKHNLYQYSITSPENNNYFILLFGKD